MKKPQPPRNILFFLFVFCTQYSFAQPGNNSCASGLLAPYILTSATGTCTTTAGTLRNGGGGATATAGISAFCGDAASPDVWYSFVAQNAFPVITLSGMGGSMDDNPRLQLFGTNSCTIATINANSLACVSATNSNTLSLNTYTAVGGAGLTVGVTYLVRVFTGGTSVAGGTAASWNFNICIVDPSSNNLCANAVALTVQTTCGATTGQSLLGANASGGPTNPYGSTYDVWYRFTTPAGVSAVQIALSGVGGSISNTNTLIEAFNSSSCAGITTLTSLGTATRQAGLTLTDLTPSTEYYFRVFAITPPSSGTWTFSICVSQLSVPANNDCAGAVALTVGTINNSGRVTNATASTGIPVGCATGTPDDDVWYSFNATSATANVTVNPNPSSGSASSSLGANGAMLQLFSGSCGSLTPIACGERGSLYATGLTSGQTYYVRVYSQGVTSANPNGVPNSGAGFSILVSVPTTTATVTAGRMNEIYRQTILSEPTLLNDPWEITYGPDGYLWITESKGYRVLRMDPNTGARTTVLDLSRKSTFFSSSSDLNLKFELSLANAQGGMAGLAIHPKFLDAGSPKNYVYVSYISSYDGGATPTGLFYTNRVVKFTYNETSGKLESPEVICDTIPGSSDHNSQRLVIAPVGGADYLFYAAGDMGAGQFGNATRPNKAQAADSYEGKILRFNLESDGDGGLLDRWIPNDNPFNPILGVQSAVWVTGIRNNQGFVYDSELNQLYGSSHGPFSDDEINVIERGKNYGHPLVIGYSWDDNVNGTTAGAAPGMNPAHPSSCPVIVDESDAAAAITDYKDPLFSGYPSSTAFPSITTLWNTTTGANAQWPSEGWSGLDLYNHTLVPGWKKSLVAASLKWGRLVRIRLNAAGSATAPTNTAQDTVSYFGSTNRFRDLAFAPNGKDVFVIMDRSATTSGPSAGNPIVPACGGCIQKYSFLGYADNAGKSSISTAVDVTQGATNFISNAGTTVTIDASNSNLWVPITGPDGNIMAEIFANGQNLGTITSSFYQHAGPIRIKGSVHYLDRSITINPATAPTSDVKVRFYISKAEYDALDADPASSISDPAQLKIYKNSDPNGSVMTAATMKINPHAIDLHGTDGYVIQSDTVKSFSTFYFAAASTTLPVDLISFTGHLQTDNTVLLKWKTENEVNTSYYIVERSVDGSRFVPVGTRTADGSGTLVFDYSLTDADAANQSSAKLYYRLKMVDLDAKFAYSDIVIITLPYISGRVAVYPNPFTAELKVAIGSQQDGRIQWKLFDNNGRTVLQHVESVKKGNNIITIHANKLSSGFYYLTVTGAGLDRKVKLQKQ